MKKKKEVKFVVLDLTNKDNRNYQSYQDSRTASIERQVAAKCAAAVLSGRTGTENEIVSVFNVFLRLIRG